VPRRKPAVGASYHERNAKPGFGKLLQSAGPG
jgi:hypothetical protein